MPWTEKHRPKIFDEVKGQSPAVGKVMEFLRNFPSRKKAIILHGPPGTGKTTLAHVAANESGAEIFELNASDFRGKNKLDEVLKPALEQQPLVKKGKIILVDEADGISGFEDRGGISELLRLIELSNYPIIITANDVWQKKLAPLRKKSELVQLKEIDYKTIKSILIGILKKENKFIENDVLTRIAINAKGDLRAAVNDLQTAAGIEKSEISKISFDERNKEIDIFNALRAVFKGNPVNDTLRVFDSVNMPIDEIILWIEENIPLEYKGEELAKAYDLLSRVDIFKGRIYKQQYWRFLVYENILLSYGISASKNPSIISRGNFTSYRKPSRILKIWLNNQRTAKKKSIAMKYAKYVHIGEKRAMAEFPIIRQIIKSNQKIQKELKLDEEEIAYLKKH